MDISFIAVSIIFFIFILIAYFLGVIRLSVPLVAIYLVYSFVYLINNEQIEENVKQDRLERLIDLQLKNTLIQNKSLIGKTVRVLVEKVSKKSKDQWSGRTEGGMWVIFDKNNENIGEVINIRIDDARGVTLFGSRVYQEYNYEVA